MKINIHPNEVEFSHTLYSVIIPKKGMTFVFDSMTATTGMPTSLNIKSKDYKVTSPFGSFLGKIFRFINVPFTEFLRRGSMYSFEPWIEKIYYVKDIKPFLQDLKKNNYDVKDVLKKLDETISQGHPKELTPGTQEWKKDKMKLVLFVILFFVGIAVVGLFISWIQSNF